jgi:peptidoglycan hydrolase CwlO-like protein
VGYQKGGRMTKKGNIVIEIILVVLLIIVAGIAYRNYEYSKQAKDKVVASNFTIQQKDDQIKMITDQAQAEQKELGYSNDKLRNTQNELDSIKRELDNLKKEFNNAQKETAKNKEALENNIKVSVNAKKEASGNAEKEILSDRKELESLKNELNSTKKELYNTKRKINDKNEDIFEGQIKEITPFSEAFSDFLGNIKVDGSTFWIDNKTVFENAFSLDELSVFDKVSIIYYVHGANKIATRVRVLK